jgi:hypothetical protein
MTAIDETPDAVFETDSMQTPGRHGQPRVPRIGDRIESRVPQFGRNVRGTIHYVDDLQVLIRWDDGRSQSLRRAGEDLFRIIESD